MMRQARRFDKTAKLLGLPYPGGAKLSELAKLGTPDAFTFPRPMLHSHDLQMSFSGLKTAVLTAVEKVRAETGNDEIPEQTRNDICRAFQDAVVDVFGGQSQKKRCWIPASELWWLPAVWVQTGNCVINSHA